MDDWNLERFERRRNFDWLKDRDYRVIDIDTFFSIYMTALRGCSLAKNPLTAPADSALVIYMTDT